MLDLPPYSTIEIMRDKLLYAIRFCGTIDDDMDNIEAWDDEPEE